MLAMLLAIFLPARATCDVGWFVNGVRPDGRYACRTVPPRDDAQWSERHGVLVEDHATEEHGRIFCSPNDIAIVLDYRHVGCRGGAVVKDVALTRKDLGTCSRPGCTCTAEGASVIELGANCHPGMGLDVRFRRATGELELSCPCGRLLARVAVAGELDIGKGN